MDQLTYHANLGTYSFEKDGVQIHYPLTDLSGKTEVSPEAYGFRVISVGGKATVWQREFELGGEVVYMHLSDRSFHRHTLTADEPLMFTVTTPKGGAFVQWLKRPGPIDSEPPTLLRMQGTLPGAPA